MCLLLAGAFGVRGAGATEWARFAIVSPTAPMSAGHICYTDGLGIACDATAPLMSGLGTGLGDRITSGTSSVFVAQDSAVSVTIGGSNVANFGTGGLGITAINASGLVTSAGVSTTGPISGTAGYFGGAPAPVVLRVDQGDANPWGLVINAIETQNPNIVLAVSGTAKWNYGYDILNGYFKFAQSGVADRIVIQDSTGNVGIGTTAPSATLHVLGANGLPSLSSSSGAQFIVGSNSSVQLTMGNRASGAYPFWIQTNQSTNTGVAFPLSLNPLGGSVGVGTITPTANLEIVGITSSTNVAAVSVTTAGIKLTSATTASAQCTTDADIGAIRLNGTRAEICSPYPN